MGSFVVLRSAWQMVPQYHKNQVWIIPSCGIIQAYILTIWAGYLESSKGDISNSGCSGDSRTHDAAGTWDWDIIYTELLEDILNTCSWTKQTVGLELFSLFSLAVSSSVPPDTLTAHPLPHGLWCGTHAPFKGTGAADTRLSLFTWVLQPGVQRGEWGSANLLNGLV